MVIPIESIEAEANVFGMELLNLLDLINDKIDIQKITNIVKNK